MTVCNVFCGLGIVTCGECDDEPEWVEVERKVSAPIVVMRCPSCGRQREFDAFLLGVK